MTDMTPEEEATAATAFHEAGHAWGYWGARKPLRYITIRPRAGGGRPGHGRCQVWRPRRIDRFQSMWIAAYGPVAEAIWAQQQGDPLDDYDFEDYLMGAVIAGGEEDLEESDGLLDGPSSVEISRELLLYDWAGITALAERLLADGTVSGRAAFELLTQHRERGKGRS